MWIVSCVRDTTSDRETNKRDLNKFPSDLVWIRAWVAQFVIKLSFVHSLSFSTHAHTHTHIALSFSDACATTAVSFVCVYMLMMCTMRFACAQKKIFKELRRRFIHKLRLFVFSSPHESVERCVPHKPTMRAPSTRYRRKTQLWQQLGDRW